MTYTTPAPPGLPDFTTAQLQPGQQLVNASFTTASTHVVGPFYVGNVNAVSLLVQANAASRQTFTALIGWSLTNSTGGTVLEYEKYVGSCLGNVQVIDTIPVQAPYMYIVCGASGTNINFAVIVMAALQTTRGAGYFIDGGLCISGLISVAAGNNQNVYGAYISPGFYTAHVRVTGNNWTGSILMYHWDGSTDTTKGEELYMNNPLLGTSVTQNVMVGTLQPVFFLGNAGGGSNSALVTLVGPQMTT